MVEKIGYQLPNFKVTILHESNKKLSDNYDIIKVYRRKNKLYCHCYWGDKLRMTFENIKWAKKTEEHIKKCIGNYRSIK
jgi:hypothetical protein